MSKLFENKQLLHIASEVVVLSGIVFYISQTNKKLMSHIDELNQRLDEQEDIIKKHERIIGRFMPQPQQPQQPQPLVQLQPQYHQPLKQENQQTKKKDKQIRKKELPTSINQTKSQLRSQPNTLNNVVPQRTTVIHMSAPFSVPQKIPQSQKIKFIDEEAKIKEEDNDDDEIEEEEEEEDEEELDSEIHNELKDLLGIDSDEDDSNEVNKKE
jgi:hypothetical protein